LIKRKILTKKQEYPVERKGTDGNPEGDQKQQQFEKIQ